MFLDIIQGLEVFPDDEDHRIDSPGVKSFTVTRKDLALRDTFFIERLFIPADVLRVTLSFISMKFHFLKINTIAIILQVRNIESKCSINVST